MHRLGLTEEPSSWPPDLYKPSYFQHPKHHLCTVRRLGGIVPRPVEHQIHRHRKLASKGQSPGSLEDVKIHGFCLGPVMNMMIIRNMDKPSRTRPKQQPNDFWVKHWLQEIWLMHTNARQTTLFASKNPSNVFRTFNLGLVSCIEYHSTDQLAWSVGFCSRLSWRKMIRPSHLVFLAIWLLVQRQMNQSTPKSRSRT